MTPGYSRVGSTTMESESLPFVITPLETVQLNFNPETSSRPDMKAEHTIMFPGSTCSGHSTLILGHAGPRDRFCATYEPGCKTKNRTVTIRYVIRPLRLMLIIEGGRKTRYNRQRPSARSRANRHECLAVARKTRRCGKRIRRPVRQGPE